MIKKDRYAWGYEQGYFDAVMDAHVTWTKNMSTKQVKKLVKEHNKKVIQYD